MQCCVLDAVSLLINLFKRGRLQEELGYILLSRNDAALMDRRSSINIQSIHCFEAPAPTIRKQGCNNCTHAHRWLPSARQCTACCHVTALTSQKRGVVQQSLSNSKVSIFCCNMQCRQAIFSNLYHQMVDLLWPRRRSSSATIFTALSTKRSLSNSISATCWFPCSAAQCRAVRPREF